MVDLTSTHAMLLLKKHLQSSSDLPMDQQRSHHFVYLACCANGTLYTGCTADIEQRIKDHNAGRGGRYTRINRPLRLVAAWPFNSRSAAAQAERQVKRLSVEEKWALAHTLLDTEP